MSRPFSSAPSSGIRSSRPDLTAVRGQRGRRPPSHSRPTDACPRTLLVGVLEPFVSADVLNEGRESHHHAGIPLPPVGVGRMAAPTVRVGLVSLPKTIDHIGALSTRGQLGHERPEHLRRTRTDGIRRHDRTTKQQTDRIPLVTGSRCSDRVRYSRPIRRIPPRAGHAPSGRRMARRGRPAGPTTSARKEVAQAAGVERRPRVRPDVVARARATASR